MRGLFTLQWHITNRCDKRCSHCYIWSKPDVDNNEPTLDQCKEVVRQFVSFCQSFDCTPAIVIAGGDPILHPNFWHILQYLHEFGIRANILGNPFHLNSDTLRKMEDCGVRTYQLSLDGMEETHDLIRQRHGSFKATLEAIDAINATKIRSKVMSTVSLINIKEIGQIARLCAENNVHGFGFARYNEPSIISRRSNRDGKEVDCRIHPLVYRYFLADMWKVYCELSDSRTTFVLKDHLFKAYLFEEGIFRPEANEEGVIYEGCNCGIRHLTLLPNGDIYACRRFYSPVGNIRDGFEHSFFSEKMEKYRQYDKYEGCSNCKLLGYCRGCHAVSAGFTGDFFSKDPQCWR